MNKIDEEEHIESFDSEEEKEKYIRFVKDEYERNRIQVKRDALREYFSTIFSKHGEDEDSPVFMFVLDIIIAGIIIGSTGIFSALSAGIALFISFFDAFLIDASENKFKGLFIALLATLCIPLNFLGKAIDKVEQAGKHKENLKILENTPVVPREKEEVVEKVQEPLTEEELISKIESTNDQKWSLYSDTENESMYEIVNKISSMKKSIADIYKEEVRMDYYARLSAICDFIEKSKKLRGKQMIEANKYIMSQLEPLSKSITLYLVLDNIPPEIEEEAERIANQVKFVPFFSKSEH